VSRQAIKANDITRNVSINQLPPMAPKDKQRFGLCGIDNSIPPLNVNVKRSMALYITLCLQSYGFISLAMNVTGRLPALILQLCNYNTKIQPLRLEF